MQLVLKWPTIAQEPWSSGKVGMYGASYVGATQWLATLTQPPHLTAIAPNVTASNYHEGWTYQGGAFELGFNVSWILLQLTLANWKTLSSTTDVTPDQRQQLLESIDSMETAFQSLPLNQFPPLKDGLADYFYDWLVHPNYDDYWDSLCIEKHHANLNIPAYHIGGWYDIFLGGTIRNVLGMREKSATDDSRRGQKLLIGPWQPPEAEPPDVFLYNPMNPVPTQGGALCCNPYFAANGAFDQQQIETRQDVLIYTTPPLPHDLEVTGPITVSLWASTSERATDFTAKLVDVCEDGCAINLTDGIIRARYRDSSSKPSLLEPGKVYPYHIDRWATNNVFKQGHQMRVEVSSSNFPRFDRNTNTGNVIAEDRDYKPALQTIFHDASHPSHITLPIVPR